MGGETESQFFNFSPLLRQQSASDRKQQNLVFSSITLSLFAASRPIERRKRVVSCPSASLRKQNSS